MTAGSGLRSKSELFQRVVSALVLAIVALATAYLGGWLFALVWAVLAVAIVYEWEKIVAPEQSPTMAIAMAAIVAIAAIVFRDAGVSPSFFIVAGAGAAAVLLVIAVRAREDRAKALWLCAGLVYASALLASVVVVRSAGLIGFFAILFLFIVVWLTDIGAYFAGRTFGGPKFAPTISPKKTWSGVIGGVACGVLCGLFVVWMASHFVRVQVSFAHAVLAFFLSVATVYGDLFESFLKRRFGVKDAGSIIPGHGGFLDRLDGFTAAAILAGLIGTARGGAYGAAQGLLAW
ncbi:MAG TPA: CDP-archaeol synthase [Beijerinckiaceae bacterium]|nr:CDP-archaeol synthase [Beijerinckiaceae bacterium]